MTSGVWALALRPRSPLLSDCGASQGSQDPPSLESGFGTLDPAHGSALPSCLATGTPCPEPHKTPPSSSPNHDNTHPVLWPTLPQNTPKPTGVKQPGTLQSVTECQHPPQHLQQNHQQNTSTLSGNGIPWCKGRPEVGEQHPSTSGSSPVQAHVPTDPPRAGSMEVG